MVSLLACVGFGGSHVYHSPKSYDNTAFFVTEAAEDQMVKSSMMVYVEATVMIGEGEHASQRRVAGSGSGTIIHDDNGKLSLLTCAHVLDFSSDSGWQKVTMVSASYFIQRNGYMYPCTAKFIDKQYDVALIKTDWNLVNKDWEVVDGFANADDICIGDLVYAAGYPGGVDTPILTQGTVTSNKFLFQWNGPKRALMASPGISPGNSGGGLFLVWYGKVYLGGMSQFTMGFNSVFGFVSISDIKRIFKEHGYAHLIH